MMTSHCLPMTDQHSKKARAPKLIFTGVPTTHVAKMAGNAMNVPSIGCVLLACALSLKPKAAKA